MHDVTQRFRFSAAAVLAACGLLPLLPSVALGQAFKLTSSTPTRHAVSYQDAVPVDLLFSQPVAPASWAGITTFVGGKHAINTKGTGANGRVLVSLATPPAPGALISLTVPASVRSQGAAGAPGATLTNPSVIEFRAAAGSGPGTFAADPPSPVPFSGGVRVVVGDVNGDGFIDVCAASATMGAVEVMLNDGTGQLLSAVRLRRTGIAGCDRLALADVDRDGDLDLIAASSTAAAVVLCANDGAGLFGTPSALGSAWGQPTDLGTADLNADGFLDVWVADFANSRIRVLPNNGSGAFLSTAAIDVPCAAGPMAVACSDFNNDGALDFAAALRDNGQVAILLWQLGQWTAGRTLNTGAGSNPVSVAAGDFTGDGKADIVVGCAGSGTAAGSPPVQAGILTFNNQSAITLTIQRLRNAAPGALPQVHLADIDGDGDLDLLCADGDQAAVVVCHNGRFTAQGTFSDGSSAARRADGLVDTRGWQSRGVVSGDLDGDGDLDLVTANAGSADISVLRNIGLTSIIDLSPVAGGFKDLPLSSGVILKARTKLAKSARFVIRIDYAPTHTSDRDLNLTSTPDGGVQLLLPAVQAAREAARRITCSVSGARTEDGLALRPFSWRFDARSAPSDGIFTNSGTPHTLPAGDLMTMVDWNDDGLMDVVTAKRTGVVGTDVLALRLRQANGSLAPPTTIPSPARAGTYTGLRCADLDADGDMEVVLTGTFTLPGGAEASVDYLLTIDTVEGESAYELPAPATALELADVNHDGDLDVIIGDATGRVTFSIGRGIKSPTAFSYAMTGPVRALSFDPGDGNSDGAVYMAIGAAGAVGAHVKRIPLDGTGGLVPAEAVRTNLAGDPAGISTEDFDGDGRADLVVAMTGRHAINTKGTAATNGRVISTGAGSAPTRVFMADLDGDDDRDLIVLCPGNNTIWLGFNDGTGAFTGRVVNLPGTPTELAVGDVNGDGRPDLVPLTTGGTLHLFQAGPLAAQDLIIGTPTTMTSGTYRNITVLDGGEAIFPTGTCVTATGMFQVKRGGTVKGGTCIFNPLGARFRLEAGAELHIPQGPGLAADGSFGPVTGAGSMYLSPDATYVYTGVGTQQTGAGLPDRVLDLQVSEAVSQLVLTQALSVGPDPAAASHSTGQGTGKVILQDLHIVGPVKPQVISNGLLTLLSSDAGATCFDVANLQAIGAVTVQTHVPGAPGSLAYHHFSPPTLQYELKDVFVSSLTATGSYAPVINPAYNTAANPFSVRPYPTVFGFNEARLPQQTDFTTGYYSPDSLRTPLPLGRGWSMYLPAGITWAKTAPLATDDVLIEGLTYTPGSAGTPTARSGQHLLGNPFANVLDWDLVTIPAGMSSAVSVWQPGGNGTGRYLTRANGMGSLENGFIGIGQGFFCQVTDPATPPAGLSLLLRAADAPKPRKDYVGHVTLMKRESPLPRLTLTLGGAGQTLTDETTVYFQPGATAGPDNVFDGVRPGRNVGQPTLATLQPDGLTELAVNGLADTDLPAGATVELLLDVPAAGTYTLRVGARRFLDDATVVLLDRHTGVRYDLADQPTVRFRTTQAGEQRGRFAVLFNGGRTITAPAAPVMLSRLTLFPNPARGMVQSAGRARPRIPDGARRAGSPHAAHHRRCRRHVHALADHAGAGRLRGADCLPNAAAGSGINRCPPARSIRPTGSNSGRADCFPEARAPSPTWRYDP